MGAEKSLVPGLLSAVRGEWGKISGQWRDACKRSRKGSDAHPGSDNLIPLAWAIALVYAKRRPNGLPSWLTKEEVSSWWHRECKTRLERGLMLKEERSRIYFGWHWAPMYVVWRLAPTTAISRMAKEWLRAQLAQMALVGVRTKPKRYNPPIAAKLFSGRLFIPLCGARSWSTGNSRRTAHHMGNSAFESVASAMIFNNWNPSQPAHVWELNVMKELGKARPMNEEDRILMRDVINAPRSLIRSQLDRLVEIAGQARWPAYLIRFSNGGGACVGDGHAFNANTAPLYTMAMNMNGTIYYIALDSGARHGINTEPCGLTFDVRGDMLDNVFAWAGGDDLPRKTLAFPARQWGDPLYVVHVTKRGAKVIWPQMAISPPLPPPPDDEEEDNDDIFDKIADVISAPFRFFRDLLGL